MWKYHIDYPFSDRHLLFPVWGYCEEGYNGYSYIGLFVNLYFGFYCINTLGKVELFNFIRTCQRVFQSYQICCSLMTMVASLVAQIVKNMPAYSLCRKIPWRREWLLTPVFLPGESHGQRSLVGYSPWGLKNWTRLSVHVSQHVHFQWHCMILVASQHFQHLELPAF